MFLNTSNLGVRSYVAGVYSHAKKAWSVAFVTLARWKSQRTIKMSSEYSRVEFVAAFFISA